MGMHLRKLFKRFGLAVRLKARIKRFMKSPRRNRDSEIPSSQSVNSQDSYYELSASCWQRLPLERVELIPPIIEALLDRLVSIRFLLPQERNATISQCSLVCRSWARALRPALLSDTIWITSVEDMRLLYMMLNSSVSGWLCIHITGIKFSDKQSQTGFWKFPLQKISLRRLTHLSNLSLTGSKPVDLGPSETRQLFPMTERVLLHNHPSLSYLYLYSFRFPSITSLFKLIANIPLLQRVELLYLDWAGDFSQPSAIFFSKLGKLQRNEVYIEVLSCTRSSALAWIPVARFVHHVFSVSEIEIAKSMVDLVDLMFSQNLEFIFELALGSEDLQSTLTITRDKPRYYRDSPSLTFRVIGRDLSRCDSLHIIIGLSEHQMMPSKWSRIQECLEKFPVLPNIEVRRNVTMGLYKLANKVSNMRAKMPRIPLTTPELDDADERSEPQSDFFTAAPEDSDSEEDHF